ncbi:MAG: hypothetical protein AAGF31_02905 [Planctomycetota bacterium]
MLWFIALVATLNLCIGYALGVYIGEMPSLPSRKPVDPPEPALDLATPAPEPAPQPTAPTSIAETTPQPVEESAEPAATTEEAAPPTQEKSKPAPTPEQVMDGMAAFQAQLAKMGADMQASIADDDAFGQHADRLQQANHDYLERTQTTLDELGDATDDESANCRDILAENAKQVGAASDEIDAMLADGVPDAAARESLIAKTEELESTVGAAERDIEAKVEGASIDSATTQNGAPDEPEAETGEDSEGDLAASAMVTIEEAQAAIQAALDAGEDQVVVAGVRHDQIELPEGAGEETEVRLLNAISELASGLIDEQQLLAPRENGELLMVLRGDDVEQATQRIETLRQQIEKATFVAGDAKLQTTVTCGLAESTDGITQYELLDFVDEAIGESERHGGNRSYHHDGRYPAPVMPEEIKVAPQTVNL